MMRQTIIIIGFALLLMNFNFNKNTLTIKGCVVDVKHIPVVGATVTEHRTKNSTITDIDGKFELRISNENNKIIVAYPGHLETEFTCDKGKAYYEIILKEGLLLDEVVITGSKVRRDKKSLGYASPIAIESHALSKISGTTKKLKYEATLKSTAPPGLVSTEKISHTGRIREADHFFGLVTAGEWNDLNHWQRWQALLKSDDYKSMHEYWKINTNNRYAIFAINNVNQAINGVSLTLQSKDGIELWKAVTDVNGKAELWHGAFDNLVAKKDLKILYEYRGQKMEIRDLKTIEEGVNQIVINAKCEDVVQAEICFVVDATGSMSDEINYLKSDLASVIANVNKLHPKLNIKLSSVFYRDRNDDYLTKHHAFTSDIESTIKFIKAQSADGGGDTPEAVEEGLELALNQNWSMDAEVPKIIFMLLDASPHEDEMTMYKYRKQLQIAAEKGIKIIPISASGIDRNTEFLLKFTSMLTNGTYVFITDDSGIGNSHLAPVHKDHDVEKLNDLITRLISGYTGKVCSNEENIASMSTKISPNPASEFLNIDFDKAPDEIIILSITGQVMMKVDPGPSPMRVGIGNLLSGNYLVKLNWGERQEVKKLIVVR